MTTDTYLLDLKPGPDPYRRHGINREPIYRLKRLLKFAARDCGFKIEWGRIPPPTGNPMIRFSDGPAAEQLLMLKRAPLFLRVTLHTLKQEWNALDQLADKPEPGEAIFVYRRVGEPSYAMIDWTEGRRRVGGKFAAATYAYVAQQPDDATLRNTEKWQAWCVSQVKQCPTTSTPQLGGSGSKA